VYSTVLFTADLTAISTSSDIDLVSRIPLQSDITVNSSTADIVTTVSVSLDSNISAISHTPDIDLLSDLLLASSITATTQTSDILLTISYGAVNFEDAVGFEIPTHNLAFIIENKS